MTDAIKKDLATAIEARAKINAMPKGPINWAGQHEETAEEAAAYEADLLPVLNRLHDAIHGEKAATVDFSERAIIAEAQRIFA